MNVNTKKTLILITSNFPFGWAEAYMETEIKYLEVKFDKIIIVSNNIASKSCRPISQNVKVVRFPYELTFSEKILSLKYLFCTNFYKELKIIKNVYKQKITFIIIRTLLTTLQIGYKTVKFLKKH